MDRVSKTLLSDISPELARRVRKMAASLSARGIEIKVTSGKRSAARQAALYANRANNPFPVALPGTSKHERGLAVDVVPTGARTSSVWAAIGEEGEREGLRWGGRFTRRDPVHFELPEEERGELLASYSLVGQENAAGIKLLAGIGVVALVIRLWKS
jgi:hypothetical protein